MTAVLLKTSMAMIQLTKRCLFSVSINRQILLQGMLSFPFTIYSPLEFQRLIVWAHVASHHVKKAKAPEQRTAHPLLPTGEHAPSKRAGELNRIWNQSTKKGETKDKGVPYSQTATKASALSGSMITEQPSVSNQLAANWHAAKKRQLGIRRLREAR
jgi:hypothetical protein